MDPEERQSIVDKFKKEIRKNNWDYLCRHPEIRAFIRVILSQAVKEKPEQIYDFIANLFHCNNLPDILERVNDQISRLRNVEDRSWTEYDGKMYFTESSESENMPESLGSSVESILTFLGLNEGFDELNEKQCM